MASEHARPVAGIDVGGRRKGFDVALLDGAEVTMQRTTHVDAVVDLVRHADVVGVDAPAAWAPPGERSRPDERAFAAAGICGIRFTPDEATARARSDGYLEWVWNGLALHAALARAGVPAIEVFPTAAWTRWLGPRRNHTRLSWTRTGWDRLLAGGMTVDGGASRRPSQDAMDATAAALVVRQAIVGRVDRFGALVVPTEDDTWPARVIAVRRGTSGT